MNQRAAAISCRLWLGLLTACGSSPVEPAPQAPELPEVPELPVDPEPVSPFVIGSSERVDPPIDTGLIGDRFGRAISVDGTRMAVGFTGQRPGAIGGGVRIYERTNDAWVEAGALAPLDNAADTAFGTSVSLDGDRVAVGAPFNGAGAVFVFEFDAGEWRQAARLEVGGSFGDGFGTTVALDGDRLIAGAPAKNLEAGAVYSFEKLDGAWVGRGVLAGESGDGERFGAALAMQGDRIAVGAPGDGGVQGAAYVFDSGEPVVLRPPTPTPTPSPTGAGGFASALALDGDRLVVGAPGSNSAAPGGGAHVFEADEVGWSHAAELEAPGEYLLGAAVAVAGDRVVLTAVSDAEERGATARALSYVSDGGAWRREAVFSPGYARAPWAGVARDAVVQLSGGRLFLGSPENDRHGEETGVVVVAQLDATAWATSAELRLTDVAGSDEFGRFVAIDGDTAVVMAPNDSTAANLVGALIVFQRDDQGRWARSSLLSPPDPTPGFNLGRSLAVDGDTIAVGARRSDGDVVYVYERLEGVWSFAQVLQSPSETAPDGFGSSVAIAGDTLLVGAPRANGLSGAVHVFERRSGLFVRTAVIAGEVGGAEFGAAVAIHGERWAAGAPFDPTTAESLGAVYVFERTADGWRGTEAIRPAEPMHAALFGRTVDIADDALVVGADFFNYAFLLDRREWRDAATFARGPSQGWYSGAVAIAGDAIVLGATTNRTRYPASADVYQRRGNSWTFVERVFAPIKEMGHDAYGATVAVDEGTMIVGSPFAAGESGFWFTGAAFLYELRER